MQLNGLDSSQKIICASIATKVLPENYFHQIPLEIIDLIFNKLDNPSRGQCEKTSRLWKSIATTYKQEQDFLIEKFIDQLITPLAKDYPDIYEACKKILTDHPLKKYNISFIEKESLKISHIAI